MLSYTYSHLLGNVNFNNGGFHQITLGLNLFCKPEKYYCNCPVELTKNPIETHRVFLYHKHDKNLYKENLQ
jgi:hypothetical protein